MFVHLICIIFVKFCILYNNPVPFFVIGFLKNAYWCPAAFLVMVNDDTADAGNTSPCKKHYDVMP